MTLRFACWYSLAAFVLFASSLIATPFATAQVIYNETWAGGYTADVSAINFGWGTFTTNAALNTGAGTVGINTVNASFPRFSPQPENVASPYPANPTGITLSPDLGRGYMSIGNSNAPQFQWTNEYLTFGNPLGVDPTAGLVTFGFSIANNATGKNARLAIQLAGGSWYASNATYTSAAFGVAALGGASQPVVPTFAIDFATTASLWRDLNFNGTLSIDPADGRGTATAGTVLSLAATARTVNLPTGNIIGWGLYWEPDGNTGGNRRADNFSVIQEAPVVPPTRFLTWNNVPGGGNGNTWDIGTAANWNSASPTNPFVYQENDAVTFNDSNNGNFTVNLNSAVKPGGVTVNTTGTYTIQGTGSIGGGHGLTLTAGTLILATDNTYSGGTVIDAGTLRIGTGGTSGRFGTKSVTNNGTMIINRSDAVTFSNTITGNGSLQHIGTGTTTLSGNNTYSGGLTVNSGAVRLGGTGAGTGTITANATSTVVFGATTTNPLSLAGGTVGVALASPLNSPITTAASTNSTLYLADPQNLPVAAADVTEVAYTNVLSGSGNLTVLSNGQDNSADAGNGFRLRGTAASTFSGRLTVGNNVKAELQTTVAGPAVFSPAGTGTLVLTAGDVLLADTLTSITTTGGYTELNLRNNTTGDVVFGNNVEVAGTGLTVLNALSDTNAPVGAKTTMGNLTIGTGQELAVYKGAGTTYTVEFPSVTLNGNATFSPRKPGFGAATSVGGDLILNNIGQSVAGSGITMAGARTLTLAGVSTYTGPTVLDLGTVVLTGSLSTAGAVNVNSGLGLATLSGTGSMGNLSLSSGTVSPGTAAAPIGTLTAQSVQTTGGTFLMQISGAAADRLNITGAASLNSATLTIAMPTPATPGTYTLFSAGTVNNLPNLSNPNIGRTNFALVQAGNNINVNVTGSAASLRWDNTGSIGDGSTWDTQSNQNWKNGAASDQFFEADNVLFNDTNNGMYTVTVAGPVLPASLVVNNNLGDYVFNGGDIGGVTSLVKNGTRALTLNNFSSFSGGLVLNAGTLNLGTPGSGTIGPIGSGRLTIQGGSIDNTAGFDFTLATNNPQTWASGFSFVGTNSLNMGTGAVTLDASPVVTVALNTLTIGGVISNGIGSGFTKAGSGVLVLAGANLYTGATNISAGTIRVTNNASLGTLTGGAVNISPGGALDISGNATAQALNFGQKQFFIAGTGVNNTGALTNSATGVSQFNAFQRVTLTADALVGAYQRFDIRAAQVNNLNTALLDLAGFTLSKIGLQHFGVVNADVTAGDIVVNEGIFAIESASRVLAANKPNNQPSTITYNASALPTGTTFQVFGGSANQMTITRPIIVNTNANNDPVFFRNSNGVESTVASPVTMNGNIEFTASAAASLFRFTGDFTEQGGPRSITKSSANTVILAGNMNYTGTTTVTLGTLQLGASNRISDSSNMVLNGGTFHTGGFNETLGTLSLQLASTLDLGAGASTLRFATSDISTLWNSNLLTINNWTPIADHVFFGTNAAGLGATTNPIGQISFANHLPGARILNTGEVVPVLSLTNGDFNQDGSLTATDLTAMLRALTNVQAWKTAYAMDDTEFNTIANIDGITGLTNRDLQAFVNVLSTMGLGSVEAVPEPSTFALLACGGLAALAYRKRRK